MLRFAPAIVALVLAPAVVPPTRCGSSRRTPASSSSSRTRASSPRRSATSTPTSRAVAAGRPRVPRLDHRPAVLPARRATTSGNSGRSGRSCSTSSPAAGSRSARQVGMDPAPALLVVQGTDEATSAEFFKLAITRARSRRRPGSRGGEAPPRRSAGPSATASRRSTSARTSTPPGSARCCTSSNKEAALHAGLDLKPGSRSPSRPGPTAARKLARRRPARVAVARLRQGEGDEGDEGLLRGHPQGPLPDARLRQHASTPSAGRTSSPPGCTRPPTGSPLTVRLPAEARRPATRTSPCTPRRRDSPAACRCWSRRASSTARASTSTSAHLWKERKTLINDQVRKDIEKGEKDISKFLPGTYVRQAAGDVRAVPPARRRPHGTRSRTRPSRTSRSRRSRYVATMRDPQFGKSIDGRRCAAAALLARFQTGLKMSEETARRREDRVATASRRSEPLPGRPDEPAVQLRAVLRGGRRLRWSCRARPALVKELIPELRKTPDPAKPSPAVWRAKAYAAGGGRRCRGVPGAGRHADAVLARASGWTRRRSRSTAAGRVGRRRSAPLELSIDHAAGCLRDRAGVEVREGITTETQRTQRRQRDRVNNQTLTSSSVFSVSSVSLWLILCRSSP